MLRHVSLVRLSSDARARGARDRRRAPRYRRVIDDDGERRPGASSTAWRAALSERVVGRTLARGARRAARRGARAARPGRPPAARARSRSARAALPGAGRRVGPRDRDAPRGARPARVPAIRERIRELLGALETKERLVEIARPDARRRAASAWRSAARWTSPRSATARWSRRATAPGRAARRAGRDRPEPDGLRARDPAGRLSLRLSRELTDEAGSRMSRRSTAPDEAEGCEALAEEDPSGSSTPSAELEEALREAAAAVDGADARGRPPSRARGRRGREAPLRGEPRAHRRSSGSARSSSRPEELARQRTACVRLAGRLRELPQARRCASAGSASATAPRISSRTCCRWSITWSARSSTLARAGARTSRACCRASSWCNGSFSGSSRSTA